MTQLSLGFLVFMSILWLSHWLVEWLDACVMGILNSLKDFEDIYFQCSSFCLNFFWLSCFPSNLTSVDCIASWSSSSSPTLFMETGRFQVYFRREIYRRRMLVKVGTSKVKPIVNQMMKMMEINKKKFNCGSNTKITQHCV